MTTPLPSLPLALPVPGWHTAATRHDVTDELARYIRNLSDSALIELQRDHRQWGDSFFAGIEESRDGLGKAGRFLSHEEWMRTADQGEVVSNYIVHEMSWRFKSAVEKRCHAAKAAAATRRRRRAFASEIVKEVCYL